MARSEILATGWKPPSAARRNRLPTMYTTRVSTTVDSLPTPVRLYNNAVLSEFRRHRASTMRGKISPTPSCRGALATRREAPEL